MVYSFWRPRFTYYNDISLREKQLKVPRTTTGKYVVEAVAKALDVLEAFHNAEDLTLNEISQRVGLNKSRTFRLLYTLAERGYVERDADGSRYRLGVKLFERAANVRRDIRDVARPFMRELRERFNEMVNFGVLEDDEVLYLEIVETSRPFRMSATVGCRMPAHQTAMGKAVIAYLGADDPRSPGRVLLNKLPPRDLKTLRKELESVRRRGYAIDDEENERGVACIGSAVLDDAGHPLAALSVSGPVHRILEHEKEIAAAVKAACEGISKKLGVNGGAGRIAGTQLARGAVGR